ncbi:YchO/YchP family invasin [Shimwellia pseudoproteus]|nr:YchO/YchP family invasin [Shimwellia pseudoproteus]MBJ3815523.1 YchO/YchP family invasin [Shimwellia pseudoproteus]
MLLTFCLCCCAALRVGAVQTFVQQAAHPLDSDGDTLPDLGIVDNSASYEQQLATMLKSFGEASMNDNGLDTGEQARAFALEQLKEVIQRQVLSQTSDLLSPWGNATLNLAVNDDGKFTGSNAAFFAPLVDDNRYLTWSQLGISQQDRGSVANWGIGQRWVRGNWLLGYNTFYDHQFADSLNRAGIGAEAWGEYLRFSANYYQPLSGWSSKGDVQQQRMAQGYDISARAWLPFYRYINTSLSLEQYFGNRVDLFNNGVGSKDPVAVNVGLSYTPVPLVTLTAQHKYGENGNSQDNLALKLNYRFGVPLDKQLSATEVAATRSLRGSRYDGVERIDVPVLAYRQKKSLSVFLATPPWDVQPGESVVLKLQVAAPAGIRTITWQGDTQPLSLTPGKDNTSPDGWTIIMPQWNDNPGATNSWQISATVEDKNGRRVTSNWITLQVHAPVTHWPASGDRFRFPSEPLKNSLLVNPDGSLNP